MSSPNATISLWWACKDCIWHLEIGGWCEDEKSSPEDKVLFFGFSLPLQMAQKNQHSWCRCYPHQLKLPNPLLYIKNFILSYADAMVPKIEKDGKSCYYRKNVQVLFLEGSKSILRLSHINTRLIGFPPTRRCFMVVSYVQLIMFLGIRF